MVSIGFEGNGSWTHKCVGSILTSNAILTSSKCMKSTTWQIRTGAENLKNPTEGERYDISTRKEVPKESYDLAILFTKKHMHFHSKAQPICLHNPELSSSHGAEKPRYLSQWNEDLTKKIIGEITIDTCADETRGSHLDEIQCQIDETTICPHDSGAPILTKTRDKNCFLLTGILSNIDENEGCKDRTTTFIRVEGKEDREKAYALWQFITDELDTGNNQGTL